MLYSEKSYEYPLLYKLLQSLCVVAGFGFVIWGLYMLFAYDFSSGGWLGIVGVPLFGIALLGILFEKANANTILINDHEIIAVKPKARVSIPWSNISHVYYSASRGIGAPQPIFSFYIFSKNNDFIIIRQYIRNFLDLMEVVLKRSPKGEGEYIPFMSLVGIFLRIYFTKRGSQDQPQLS